MMLNALDSELGFLAADMPMACNLHPWRSATQPPHDSCSTREPSAQAHSRCTQLPELQHSQSVMSPDPHWGRAGPGPAKEPLGAPNQGPKLSH